MQIYTTLKLHEKENLSMDNLSLSTRLKTIAAFVPTGKKVADIGSDHALLPAYLIKNRIAPYVVAGEVNEGPFQTALNYVKSLNLSKQIDVRKGNGLEVISENEVDVITIAGMGGALIATILDEGKHKLSRVQRLILQPNVGEALVRHWLKEHQWSIIDEEILEENEKIYEIIVAERNQVEEEYPNGNLTDEELLQIGPKLWQKQSPLLNKKWEKEIEKVNFILRQIENSKSDNEEKKQALLTEKQRIEKVIQCMQKDRPSSSS